MVAHRQVRVLVADAAAPTRMGLRMTLERAGFEVAAEAADADAAVAAALAEPLDAGLIHAGLPGGGLEAVRRIAAGRPAMRLIVLTGGSSREELVAAVLAGAVGYLGSDVDVSRLPAILNGVLAGEVALPRAHTQYLLEKLRGRDARRALIASLADPPLTDREWEVLQLVAEKRSTGEIAAHLGISPVTARRHLSSLRMKLRVSDRAEAAELLLGGAPE